jgi:outer membrane protein TolC
VAQGVVLFSGVIPAIVTLTARCLIGRRRRSMSMARASVVLVLCLLAAAPVVQAQAPPGTPPTAPPAPAAPATPAPATPAMPPPTAAQPILQRVIGRVLSLEEAVGIALEAQPQIQARLHDYMAAAHRVDQAFSTLLPQLTGSWTAARLKEAVGNRETNRTITTIRPLNERTEVGVTLSQVLFDFGKTFASTEAARRLAEVAQEDVELQRQLITLTVKESFININFARRLIRVQEQSLERADLNLRSARGFFEVGTRPKSDVARAEVDVANARVDLIRARNAERLARVALNTAMGIPADTQTEVGEILFYQKMSLDRTRLQSQALAQRPEYKQARLRVSEAEARARRAYRDFFPDISGAGTYGAARADMNEVWELRLELQWSIFDGGNRISRYRESKVNIDGAVARVKALELDISREVEQAYLVVNEADERIAAAQTAVASAQENFRLAQGRFDAGVGTILELTDAQLFLTQAQNTEAQALADYRIALARLERATGQR